MNQETKEQVSGKFGLIALVGLISLAINYLYHPSSLISVVTFFVSCIVLGILIGKLQEELGKRK